ncbi:hypothetical protein ANN_21005 [Periplaneta americana]|uniref:Uncharacterized protein n=1 Tax=Periplaneta americana TaxID=6978 RepID=A0ABQ8SE67_PERAM|nr:hypothetical protein ANN_21005 [Periplaneta americana]
MSPGSRTESYPAFAHIGLRENPGKTSTRKSGKVVALIEGGNSQRYVATVLEIPRSTVQRVYHRFRETGVYSRRSDSGRKRVTSARKRVRSRLTPHSNLQQLRNVLSNEWNRIDQAGIQNLIEGLNRRMDRLCGDTGDVLGCFSKFEWIEFKASLKRQIEAVPGVFESQQRHRYRKTGPLSSQIGGDVRNNCKLLYDPHLVGTGHGEATI